jgi:hypothetical protein
VVSKHYRRYRKGSLRSCVQDAGFSVARLTYFNTLLFAPIAAVRLVARLFPQSIQSESSDCSPAVNTLLYRIFNLEVPYLRYASFPFGVSILCVATKNPVTSE